MNPTSNTFSADWPEARQFKRSIRVEFLVFVAVIIILLMSVTGYVISDIYIDIAVRNVAEKLLVQTRSYSGSAGKLMISANGPDALLLNNICNKIKGDNPDVYWAGVADLDGRFIAHINIKQVVTGARMPKISGEEYSDILQKGESLQLSGDTAYVAIPILENGIMVGKFGVAASSRQIAEVRRTTLVTISSITIIMILIGLPLTMIMIHRKLRPIGLITDGLKKIDFTDISLQIPVKAKNEFGYLAESLNVMARKLNVAQKDMVEKQRIAREMEIAREIQEKILPKEYPRDDNFVFHGVYQSALMVGGDYYDFINFGDDYLAWVVADVSGKSLPGMLVMLLTRDIIRNLGFKMKRPAEILNEVNRELLPNIKKGMFVTMFYGLLDKKSGRFEFASAGHNPLIRLNPSKNTVESLKTKGYPLGMLPPGPFSQRLETGQFDLAEGDWLVQYTDGVNEAKNRADEEFGMERFLDILKESWSEKPHLLIKRTIEKHAEFVAGANQFDDITLIAMKWQRQTADINKKAEKEVDFAV